LIPGQLWFPSYMTVSSACCGSAVCSAFLGGHRWRGQPEAPCPRSCPRVNSSWDYSTFTQTSITVSSCSLCLHVCVHPQESAGDEIHYTHTHTHTHTHSWIERPCTHTQQRGWVPPNVCQCLPTVKGPGDEPEGWGGRQGQPEVWLTLDRR